MIAAERNGIKHRLAEMASASTANGEQTYKNLANERDTYAKGVSLASRQWTWPNPASLRYNAISKIVCKEPE